MEIIASGFSTLMSSSPNAVPLKAAFKRCPLIRCELQPAAGADHDNVVAVFGDAEGRARPCLETIARSNRAISRTAPRLSAARERMNVSTIKIAGSSSTAVGECARQVLEACTRFGAVKTRAQNQPASCAAALLNEVPPETASSMRFGPRAGDEADGMQRRFIAGCLRVVHQTARDVSAIAGLEHKFLP